MVGLVLTIGGLVAIVHGQIVFGLIALILTPIVLWLMPWVAGVVALGLLAPGRLIERRREQRLLGVAS